MFGMKLSKFSLSEIMYILLAVRVDIYVGQEQFSDLVEEFTLCGGPFCMGLAALQLAEMVQDLELELNGQWEAQSTLSGVPIPSKDSLDDVELAEAYVHPFR